MAGEKRRTPNGTQSESSTKRAKTEEIPFKIQMLHEATANSKRRRLSSAPKDVKPSAKEDHSTWPFQHTIGYVVLPNKQWDTAKSYRHFDLSKVKYAVNDFVLVNNGEIDKGNEGDENAGFWPAKILEIRALDQAHVYARVYWLYWPDDLPSGRENFHGESEVIASNHMDVIDVTTVSEKIQVLHYLESDNIAPPAKGYYWRQTFNPYSGRLSSLKLGCICNGHLMSGRPIVRCQNKSCGRFLHEDCIAKRSKRKTLGLDKSATPSENSDDGLDGEGEVPSGDPKEAEEEPEGEKGKSNSNAKPQSSKVADAKKVNVYIVHKKDGGGAGNVSWKLVIEDSRSGTLATTEKRLTCSQCGDRLSQ